MGRRLSLLTFSHSAELPIRLRAMRAGADSFIPLPAQSGDVMERVSELLDAENSDPFRVLIVEDDRSQAIFAESILRKAGMSTNAVTDPLAALDQLEKFHPELILMDLYMPNCSGMELTSIIREREAFINTPIVFLSGEQNQEMHFEALNAGGDDFLSKPIRPKHLISAVTNRVRRARSMGRRAMAQNPRDPVTGLYDRAFVLDRLNAKLAAEDPASQGGGLLYVVIDGAGQIRERVGLTIFEALLNQVGAFVTAHIDDKDIVARYGDTSFALLAGAGDEDALIGIASDLRDRIAREVFEHEGKTLTVSLAIGICPFSAGLGDAGAMLNAAERAMTDSRSAASGQTRIGVFHPTRPKSTTDEHQTITQLIRDALKAEDFQLLFQPIVALQGDNEETFQALLRLRGPDGKLYTAAEILPLAEREGLSADVDRWVVSRCLLVMAERQRQMRPVRLFVSQSMEAALDSSRTGWLRQLLETRRLLGRDAGARIQAAGSARASQRFRLVRQRDRGTRRVDFDLDIRCEGEFTAVARTLPGCLHQARHALRRRQSARQRGPRRTAHDRQHGTSSRREGDRLAHRRRTERLAIVERRHRLSARRLRAAGRPGSGVRLQCHHGLTRTPAT